MEWIDERPKVSNLALVKSEQPPLSGSKLLQTGFINIKKEKTKETAAIQTLKDIVIHRKNVTKQIKELVSVPKAVNDGSLPTSAEHLSVYVDKKWVPNKQELEEENIKDGPSFAKVKQPANNTQAASQMSILNDESSNLQVGQQNLASHHVGRSVGHTNNMAIKQAILAASDVSNGKLINKMADKSNVRQLKKVQKKESRTLLSLAEQIDAQEQEDQEKEGTSSELLPSSTNLSGKTSNLV